MYLTAHPNGIPYALNHQWNRTHTLFDTIVLVTIIHERRPRVSQKDRYQIEKLRDNFYRVTAHYGFMETPKGSEILEHCDKAVPEWSFKGAVYYLAESTVVPGPPGHRMPRWQRMLFGWLVTNSVPIETELDIPPDRVVKIGVSVPV